MKKLLFLLFALVSITMHGQTANGSETPLEGLIITDPQNISTPVNIATMGADGTVGKASISNLKTTLGYDVLQYTNFSDFPATGQVGKAYIWKAMQQAYYWDGATYKIITDTSKENTANKQNSLVPDGTGTKIATVDAVNSMPMQPTYDNSSVPQIVVSETKGAMTFKNNRTLDYSNSTEWVDREGMLRAGISGVGGITSGDDLKIQYNTLNFSFISPAIPSPLQQGYAFDGTDHYIFDITRISKRDGTTWTETVANTSPLTGIAGVTHIGDGVYLGGFLYAPVENYILNASTNMKIAKYDAATLLLITTYDVAAQGHECSSITTDGTDLYISSYDDGTKFWKYSTTGTFLGAINMSSPFTDRVQGISYYSGYFYVVEQTKLSKVNLSGTTRVFLGYLPGDTTTEAHRGYGIENVAGVSRVLQIAYGTRNVYYFTNTSTSTNFFNVDKLGKVTASGDFYRKPKTTNTNYSDVLSGSIILGSRQSGSVPLFSTRTASASTTGLFQLTLQSADAAKTGEADMSFQSAFETGNGTLQSFTSAGDMFSFSNGSNRALTIRRQGSVKIGFSANTADGINKLDVNGGIGAAGISLSSETINTIASFDASKNIVSLSTATYPSLTELSYLKGVTAPISNTLSGTYTPTLTGTVNTSGVVLISANYTVIGNVVTVRIDATVDPISATTQTSFTATLPYTMSGATQTSLGSGCVNPMTDFLPVLVQKNSATLVNVVFKTQSDTNNAPISITFTYLK